MIPRILKPVVPIVAATTIVAGCLELTTTDPNTDPDTSWSSSSASSGSSSASSGSSSASSSSSSSASSSSSSAASSSSSASSSSGIPMPGPVVAKSDFGSTLRNDSGAVVCGGDAQTLPSGISGTALECTHITNTSGRFTHGLDVNLTAGVKYLFSFYFRNGTFDSPYGQSPTVGITMKSPNGGGYGSLITFDAFPNQWYRQIYPFTASATGMYQIGFDHNLDRPPGGGYWLYGFQVQEGYMVSDYVPE